MTDTRKIYCCGCLRDVEARLVTGKQIYPKRKDLALLPFWKCETCGNHVGCHWKSGTPTKPLGNIPTKELRKARQHIHRILDPLWKSKRMRRGSVYSLISEELGYSFHTGEIKSVEEARRVYRIVLNISKEKAA